MSVLGMGPGIFAQPEGPEAVRQPRLIRRCPGPELHHAQQRGVVQLQPLVQGHQVKQRIVVAEPFPVQGDPASGRADDHVPGIQIVVAGRLLTRRPLQPAQSSYRFRHRAGGQEFPAQAEGIVVPPAGGQRPMQAAQIGDQVLQGPIRIHQQRARLKTTDHDATRRVECHQFRHRHGKLLLIEAQLPLPIDKRPFAAGHAEHVSTAVVLEAVVLIAVAAAQIVEAGNLLSLPARHQPLKNGKQCLAAGAAGGTGVLAGAAVVHGRRVRQWGGFVKAPAACCAARC